MLTNPSVLDDSDDISYLPHISIFDIYNYLMNFKDFDHASLREYTKMEGYSMFEDGYVLQIKTCKYAPENEQYVAIKSHVKPRTNEKDPISKKQFYQTWIIITSNEENQRGCIYSAYCTCKGGMDGACRHVVATLFEVMDFISDAKKQSVTSGACVWVRRARENEDPVLVTDLDTSYSRQRTDTPLPTEDDYIPIDPETELPRVSDFNTMVKKSCPNACYLDTQQVRPNRKRNDGTPQIKVKIPIDKIQAFFQCHDCGNDCCTNVCFEKFKEELTYDQNGIENIEQSTRGQNDNENWHKVRKGLLTASRFKEIIHCRDMSAMANKMIDPSPLNEQRLPAPIEFGRNYEDKARMMYIKSHRYHHRKCTFYVPGFMLCPTNQLLGASPDCIVKCDSCGEFLIEVKCMYTNRNFHPKDALVVSKICDKKDDGSLSVVKIHKYYYQMQGQMGVSGVKKCVLVAYTHKGIHSVDVPFDVEFWTEMEKDLSIF